MRFVPPLRGSITGWTSWGLHPRLLHATPPAFRTIHASGVQNHKRLRRSEPRPSPSLRTMLAFSDSNDGRLRRSEPCHASGVPNRVRLWRPTAIRIMPSCAVRNHVRNAILQTQQPFGFLQQKIDILEGLVTDVLPTNSAGTIDQIGSMQRLTFEIVVSMKGPKHIVVCVG